MKFIRAIPEIHLDSSDGIIPKFRIVAFKCLTSDRIIFSGLWSSTREGLRCQGCQYKRSGYYTCFNFHPETIFVVLIEAGLPYVEINQEEILDFIYHESLKSMLQEIEL